MTALLTPPAGPPAGPDAVPNQPSWHVVADLTPPELLAARQLGVLRKQILSALIVVALLCVAAYGYVSRQHTAASDEAAAAGAQTVTLQHAAAKYTDITGIENAVAAGRAQVAGVMRHDVDVVSVLNKIGEVLPASFSVDSITLTLSDATAGTASGGLDASGHAVIGTVAITGTGRSLDAVAGFIDRLAGIRGFANVLPGSNLMTGGAAHFNLTLSLTDVLYSHRFDAKKPRGK